MGYAMAVHYSSLLLATVISGFCLSITMFAFWMISRRDGFKLTWSLGILVLVGHVIAYAFYADKPHPVLGALVVGLLPLGLAIIHYAALQFFDRMSSIRRVVTTFALALGIALPALFAGFDGIAFMIQNAAAATLLTMSGNIYFRSRAEAPTPLTLMAGLYYLAAASFALCGLVLLLGGQWTVGGVPDNWAERINIVIAILGLTGAGALSVALDQTRLAQHHRSEAVTDPLTGLLNRRGMILTVPEEALGLFAAIAIFDLDHFKQVNDRHGHSAGDDVLVRFAQILKAGKRDRDIAVRLGGEEFALVMPRVTDDQAAGMVRRICARLAAEPFAGKGPFRCTVSAGIGFGDDGHPSIREVLARADQALYTAKKAGRNRIEIDGHLRLAV